MALEAVQAQAGHASIESTRIYLHLADDWLAAQYRKAAEVIDAQVFAGQAAGPGVTTGVVTRGRVRSSTAGQVLVLRCWRSAGVPAPPSEPGRRGGQRCEGAYPGRQGNPLRCAKPGAWRAGWRRRCWCGGVRFAGCGAGSRAAGRRAARESGRWRGRCGGG